jgi:hypothetical protein
MKKDVHTFVEECDVFQCNKGEAIKSPGTLQLLSIPPTIWRYISMDFIVGLPKSGNKSVIMVVIDHLSKYDNLCSLQHPFTSSTVDQIFMDHVFKLHGMPHSIFYDHDGKNEVVNKCLETYLRCFASERKNQWDQW